MEHRLYTPATAAQQRKHTAGAQTAAATKPRHPTFCYANMSSSHGHPVVHQNFGTISRFVRVISVNGQKKPKCNAKLRLGESFPCMPAGQDTLCPSLAARSLDPSHKVSPAAPNVSTRLCSSLLRALLASPGLAAVRLHR